MKYSFNTETDINMIEDQASLAKIVIESTDDNIRKTALEKITDQSLLANIVIESTNDNIRKTALEMVVDELLLAESILKIKDDDICKIITDRITDKSLLTKIFENARIAFNSAYSSASGLGSIPGTDTVLVAYKEMRRLLKIQVNAGLQTAEAKASQVQLYFLKTCPHSMTPLYLYIMFFVIFFNKKAESLPTNPNLNALWVLVLPLLYPIYFSFRWPNVFQAMHNITSAIGWLWLIGFYTTLIGFLEVSHIYDFGATLYNSPTNNSDSIYTLFFGLAFLIAAYLVAKTHPIISMIVIFLASIAYAYDTASIIMLLPYIRVAKLHPSFYISAVVHLIVLLSFGKAIGAYRAIYFLTDNNAERYINKQTKLHTSVIYLKLTSILRVILSYVERILQVVLWAIVVILFLITLFFVGFFPRSTENFFRLFTKNPEQSMQKSHIAEQPSNATNTKLIPNVHVADPAKSIPQPTERQTDLTNTQFTPSINTSEPTTSTPQPIEQQANPEQMQSQIGLLSTDPTYILGLSIDDLQTQLVATDQLTRQEAESKLYIYTKKSHHAIN